MARFGWMNPLEDKEQLARIHEHPLFAGLPTGELGGLLAQCGLKRYQKGERVLYAKTPRQGLLLILQGMAEVFVGQSSQREVLEVLEKGDMIGFSSLADFLAEKNRQRERYPVEVRAIEETLCLHIPYTVIELRWHEPAVRDFILKQVTVRLRDIYASLAEQVTLAKQWGESEPFIRRIHDVMKMPMISADMEEDVRDVAAAMVGQATSSVVVLNDNDQLIGIITEKDLVERVVAKGLGAGTVARDIMTPHPYIISRDAFYYEAMSVMLMNGIKHLPVMDGGRVAGMVSLSDLLQQKNRGVTGVIQKIEEATPATVDRLKPAMYEVLSYLIQDEIPVVHTLDVMTKLYDRLARHCVELALNHLAENGSVGPPVAFGWYMMGSGGRGEQFMLTDQDHFLVYADPPNEAKRSVDQYFAELGKEIVRQLELAGYKRCDGLMMASEDRWRGAISTWQERLRGWSLRATNDHVLLANNFLSFRHLYGDEELHDQFTAIVRVQLVKSRIFLYRMAELEKEHPVPQLDHPIRALFRMKRETIDGKKHALFPLHHSIQLLAARHGIVDGTPLELLEKLIETNVLSRETADDLRFAYEVILRIRLQSAWHAHQRGEPSSSEIHFSRLRTKDKEELILALRAIRSLQNQAISF
ncbi:DUF294 nucleotidyltransferase-like domain-containing protein [Alkalihalobacillus oceani]|uniref:DUF294 nucleotidyltransferase-like domain-containing protein n=1 Tax=Halalkalibacter oceani TaxID=1653776 RepID=A0A9X2DP29_9BACI|nr:DUF294 nucleotidyltransferase-like domain-containing protein [Halalkalibacter oceani]MCM3714314.1 DUF294 nucleotidyltransferase-like domain-containing protein [Halalkalibacter oceani]